MSNGLTAKRDYSLKRVFRKFYQSLAQSKLVPSSLRVPLFKAAGVNFTDPKSTFIGENVYFDDTRPDLITVGKWVRITIGTKIFTHFFDTDFVPEPNRPFRFYEGEVKIGDYVFIGANVVISKPVTIGDWAVIGSNSVITKDVPPGAVVSGAPAKEIGRRKIEQKH